MPKKPKRRIRSPHPGVVILERRLPSGRVAHQARFRDADGVLRKPMLDPALSTAEARRGWAVHKSRELAGTRLARERGDGGIDVRTLSDAITTYNKGAANRLRDKTVATYRTAIDNFEAWAKHVTARTTADLTKARLSHLRDYLIALPKLTAAKQAQRGRRKATARKRSNVSINRELRTLKTLLNAMRTAGQLHLHRDDISDALKPLPVAREQPTYLRAADLKQLLRAALAHDAARFKATRAEHRGDGTPGDTQRHTPIAAFTAVLLLTGMRRGEALALEWSNVDLDAVDAQGVVVGEIRLKGEGTKTRQARTIGLEVSPALLEILKAMHKRRGKAVRVFEDLSADSVDVARERMIAEYGAPAFDWQALRSTCATYLTNAPAIFGAATVFLSARQLGHSVAIAEKHYLGVHRGIPKDAHTLEDAMGIGPAVAAIAAD